MSNAVSSTTALYHALMTPTIYSDVNGEYIGMDGKVHHRSRRPERRSTPTSPAGMCIAHSSNCSPGSIPKRGSDIAQSLLQPGQPERRPLGSLDPH